MIPVKTVNDRLQIKRSEVEAVVRTLCVPYSLIRRSFKANEKLINATIDAGEITAAIVILCDVYQLPQGYIRRVGYNAQIPGPAGLETFFDLGSKRVIEINIFFQYSKENLQKMPRYQLIHLIAHELAHARLRKDNHPLTSSEFATDVLAVLVTGDSRGYTTAMLRNDFYSGYIRPDLLNELFHHLNRYADSIYLS